MRPISSKLTAWHKRVAPVLWFALLLCAGAWMASTGRYGAWAVLAPTALALAGFVYMRRITFRLADAVLDDGDALVIRRKGRELRVLLANVTGVNYSFVAAPPRITITFATPAVPAAHVQFMPCAVPGMLLFRQPPLVADLRKRAGARHPSTKIRE